MKTPNRRKIVKATQKAAQPIKDNFRRPIDVQTKKDGTPVTAVDMAVHEYLMNWVTKYPGLGYIGEEGNSFSEESRYAIYVDPYDGTSAGIRGIPTPTTVVALMEHVTGDLWKPTIAVIHEPILGWTWSATEAGEIHICSDDGKNIEVHESRLLDRVAPYQITVSDWPGAPHNMEQVKELVNKRPEYREQSFGSIALGAGLIASGLMHATIFGSKSAVETAAMSLIVRNAGGIVTDLFGESLDLYLLVEQNGKLDFELPDGAIMSSHQEITDDLVKIVKAVQ